MKTKTTAARRDVRRLLIGSAAAVVWALIVVRYFAEGRWLVGLTVIAAGAAVYFAIHLPKEQYVFFAAAAIALSVVVTLLFVAGLDFYLHKRYENRGGYNIWGYRGAVVKGKRPGEWRAVMLGGSTAFGYGVAVDHTIPAYLEQRLNELRQRQGKGSATVVNLAWNSQGAYSFPSTLNSYEYLDYNAAILSSGYNDLGYNNMAFRDQSALFRLTGYLPILPVIPVRDWLHIRDLSDTYRDDRAVFSPNLTDRYAAEAADTALRISRELERQLGRLSPESNHGPSAEAGECGQRWAHYCKSIGEAVDYGVRQGKTVFVVTEPYISDSHVDQQREMASMLRSRFGRNSHVHYVDLGRSVSLRDRALCYDGMHLTSAGNAKLAAALAAAMEQALP